MQPDNQQLIFGQSSCPDDGSFLSGLRRTFIEAVVQTLSDTTLDIKEYLVLGRTCWPVYIEPLHPTSIDKTIEAVLKPKYGTVATDDPDLVKRELLSFLGTKLLPQLRGFMDRATTVNTLVPFEYGAKSVIPNNHSLPRLSKYMLLAAYLCQVNRPDRDKHLFSIQKNGKKRRSMDNGEAAEATAFGSQTTDIQAKSFRPKSFPAERMLSVYVNLVGLHDFSNEEETLAGNRDKRIQSLGSCALYETLTHLRDIGLIHEQPSRSVSEPIRMSDIRYWCSLSRDEALTIAKSIALPLDNYLR